MTSGSRGLSAPLMMRARWEQPGLASEAFQAFSSCVPWYVSSLWWCSSYGSAGNTTSTPVLKLPVSPVQPMLMLSSGGHQAAASKSCYSLSTRRRKKSGGRWNEDQATKITKLQVPLVRCQWLQRTNVLSGVSPSDGRAWKYITKKHIEQIHVDSGDISWSKNPLRSIGLPCLWYTWFVFHNCKFLCFSNKHISGFPPTDY